MQRSNQQWKQSLDQKKQSISPCSSGRGNRRPWGSSTNSVMNSDAAEQEHLISWLRTMNGTSTTRRCRYDDPFDSSRARNAESLTAKRQTIQTGTGAEDKNWTETGLFSNSIATGPSRTLTWDRCPTVPWPMNLLYQVPQGTPLPLCPMRTLVIWLMLLTSQMGTGTWSIRHITLLSSNDYDNGAIMMPLGISRAGLRWYTECESIVTWH